MNHTSPKQPLLVSFSGMDGAGKSTQISALRERLRELGLRVTLITFWDDVARLKGMREATGHAIFKGDKGVGSPEAPVNRRDKNVQSPAMTVLRFFLYFIDAISLRRVALRAQRSTSSQKGDVVIFDRYAYDELANLNLRNPLVRAYARFIMTIVPRPHISFILDAEPAAARARKPEYPLDFLAKCRKSYLAIAELIGGITVVEPMPLESVKQKIIKNALEMLQRDSTSSAWFEVSENPVHQR